MNYRNFLSQALITTSLFSSALFSAGDQADPSISAKDPNEWLQLFFDHIDSLKGPYRLEEQLKFIDQSAETLNKRLKDSRICYYKDIISDYLYATYNFTNNIDEASSFWFIMKNFLKLLFRDSSDKNILLETIAKSAHGQLSDFNFYYRKDLLDMLKVLHDNQFALPLENSFLKEVNAHTYNSEFIQFIRRVYASIPRIKRALLCDLKKFYKNSMLPQESDAVKNWLEEATWLKPKGHRGPGLIEQINDSYKKPPIRDEPSELSEYLDDSEAKANEEAHSQPQNEPINGQNRSRSLSFFTISRFSIAKNLCIAFIWGKAVWDTYWHPKNMPSPEEPSLRKTQADTGTQVPSDPPTHVPLAQSGAIPKAPLGRDYWRKSNSRTV